MTDIPEMASKYAELMEAPVDEATINENGESLSTLCQSEWVRILVIRRPSTPDLVTIEYLRNKTVLLLLSAEG